MAIHRPSTLALVSDEENTSEYEPSSQHSTLDSNPDVAECIKVIKQHANDNNSNDSSGSESDDAAPNDPSIRASHHFQRDIVAEEVNAVRS